MWLAECINVSFLCRTCPQCLRGFMNCLKHFYLWMKTFLRGLGAWSGSCEWTSAGCLRVTSGEPERLRTVRRWSWDSCFGGEPRLLSLFFLGPPLLTRPLSASATMTLLLLPLAALLLQADSYFSEEKYPEESKVQPPTVVIAIIARNAAHSLPFYLGALDRLNYPKERITVWWVAFPVPLLSLVPLLQPFKRSTAFKWVCESSSFPSSPSSPPPPPPFFSPSEPLSQPRLPLSLPLSLCHIHFLLWVAWVCVPAPNPDQNPQTERSSCCLHPWRYCVMECPSFKWSPQKTKPPKLWIWPWNSETLLLLWLSLRVLLYQIVSLSSFMLTLIWLCLMCCFLFTVCFSGLLFTSCLFLQLCTSYCFVYIFYLISFIHLILF